MAKANLKPTTKLCAVVKADAYGHGAVRAAPAAARPGNKHTRQKQKKMALCAERRKQRVTGQTFLR